MSALRILVVDDHEVIRRVICSLLSSDPTLDVVCQTADGEQAVLKAQELQPDLVLLDISLPGMSGIEAAKRIRSSSPNSHIIFLCQHDSLQVVESAMRMGGHGYVAKIDAGSELLNAIRTVSAGQEFVSQRIVSQGWKMDRLGRGDNRQIRTRNLRSPVTGRGSDAPRDSRQDAGAHLYFQQSECQSYGETEGISRVPCTRNLASAVGLTLDSK
jgi:DNA-binding NarL/FixJ family response regulator